MTFPGWLPWLLLEMATAGVVVWLWRQLRRIQRSVHRLVHEEKISELPSGSGLVRATLSDLHELELRFRAIGEQRANEDFSLRAILSSMAEGVMILDRQLQIRLTNRRLQEMFLLPQAPLERTPMEVFRNHFLQRVIQETLQSGSPRSAELQVELREGDHFATKHFQVTSVSLRPKSEDELAGILLVFHDISQLRSLEAVRKEFVANVSHELRTPLSILSGYLETLLDEEVDQETARRFMATMYRHAKRLNALLEDLLLLSQLEARRLPLQLTTVTARECFERVLERFESMMTGASARVTVLVPADLSWTTDASRLEQALSNLVDNALKHCGTAGLELTLAAEAEGEDVVLRVADNGPGIPLGDQPHIFERFYRVYKDRSRDAGGTGLGLAIVKHTIQALGGNVYVTSSPGKGATFTVRLPKNPK